MTHKAGWRGGDIWKRSAKALAIRVIRWILKKWQIGGGALSRSVDDEAADSLRQPGLKIWKVRQFMGKSSLHVESGFAKQRRAFCPNAFG